MKPRSREIRVYTFPIALWFDRHIGGGAAEIKFRSDAIIITPNLAVRDFTRFSGKTSIRLGSRGPGCGQFYHVVSRNELTIFRKISNTITNKSLSLEFCFTIVIYLIDSHMTWVIHYEMGECREIVPSKSFWKESWYSVFSFDNYNNICNNVFSKWLGNFLGECYVDSKYILYIYIYIYI